MIFLVDLPAPVHGMSSVNLMIAALAKKIGLQPILINSVPSRFSRFYGTRKWFLIKLMYSFYVCLVFLSVIIRSSSSVLYRPVNGGFGQFYDLVYIALARAFGFKIFMHHHSFQYLNARSHVFALLAFVAGKEACHVVLGRGMAEKLKSLYGISDDSFLEVSNAAFFRGVSPSGDLLSRQGNSLIIGHLANLCDDKGVNIFAAICRELSLRGVRFSAKIAGPFFDASSKSVVELVCGELSEVEYLGPLYGEAKDIFFEELDVFVFPSKYKNEAEPLVLYEAAEHGAFLIGSSAGCMRNSIDVLGGVCLPIKNESEWVVKVVDCIQEQYFNIQSEVSRGARVHKFNSFVASSRNNLTVLMQRMLRAES